MAFNIWCNIWNIQEFGRDIFPYIDKYPSSLFSSVKTISWSETRYNKLACWERFINFCFRNLRISTFPITASARSSNLFLIEFMLMWDIMIRFKFAIVISFIFLKVILWCYSGNRNWFLHISSFRIIWSTVRRKVWFSMLGITSELDEHKGCSGSRILFFLIQEHPLFI